MKSAFWFSLGFILYTYAGYLLWLALLKMIQSRQIKKVHYEPTVSVVVAARNEEKNIARRVRDILAQDYPPEKLEIVVVSDGSSDRTVEVLAALKASNLKVIALPDNRGKAIALNVGVAAAESELVIFTDAQPGYDLCRPGGWLRQWRACFSAGCRQHYSDRDRRLLETRKALR